MQSGMISAGKILRDKSAGTPIMFYRSHRDLWTISHFNPQAARIPIEHADIGELERDLQYARSQKSALWLVAAAYDMIAADLARRRWLDLHERPSELLEVKDEKSDFRFTLFDTLSSQRHSVAPSTISLCQGETEILLHLMLALFGCRRACSFAVPLRPDLRIGQAGEDRGQGRALRVHLEP
jgi:hypothetical protein